MMREKKRSILLMGLGSLLLVSSCMMIIGNIMHSKQAQEASSFILENLDKQILISQQGNKKNSKRDNLVKVDENIYLGKLEIPALGLVLPINNVWSYPILRETPSRYKGSIEEGSLIIMAHNYNTHFGNIHLLREEDEVRIIRSNGEIITYKVLAIEVLKAEAIDSMEAGNWDLTLFTCSYDGTKRIAVRCKQYK